MSKLFSGLNIWAWVAILTLIISAAGSVTWWIYSTGFDAANQEVDEQDDKAISDADLAALGYDDCTALRNSGERVRFIFRTGECVRIVEGSQSE